MPPSLSVLSIVGLGLDLVGALVIAAPDLPVLKSRLTPERLEEARSQLLDVGHLSKEDVRYGEFVSVLQANVEWLDTEPYRLVVDHYPARGTEALYVVYEPDGLGPFDDLDDEAPIEAQQRESYDWVADAAVVYGWVGDEIVRTKRQTRLVRGLGAVLLAVGFASQLLPYAL